MKLIILVLALICYSESASLNKRQIGGEFDPEQFKQGLLKHAEELISRAAKDVEAAGENLKQFASGVDAVVAHIKEVVEKINAAGTNATELGMLEWDLMQAEGMLDWELAMLEQMESGGGLPGNPFGIPGGNQTGVPGIPGNPVKRQVEVPAFNATEFKNQLIKHGEDLISRAEKDIAAAEDNVKQFATGVQAVVAHIKEVIEKINAATDETQLGMLEWDLMQAEGMLDWELAMLEQMEAGGVPEMPGNPWQIPTGNQTGVPGVPAQV